MVAALKDSLLDESKQDVLHAEVLALIDGEVSDKKGVSGIAVKGGYSAVKKVSPTMLDDAVTALWPEFVAKLEPFWQSYNAAKESGSGAGTFADYLVAHSDQASDALLGVTDERVAKTTKTTVKKVYGSLRGSAKKNVEEALPRLGALVQKQA